MFRLRLAAMRGAVAGLRPRPRRAGVGSLFGTRRRHLFAVIPATEVLFEPDVQADEQVPAPHFLQLELRLAATAVPPSDRNYGPTVSPDDHLQRQLHGKVK